jgi:CheY-like chemotaxis protein
MPSADSKVVLVIDDDAFIRRVIELKLKRQGYQVVTASNGADGLELVERLKPDVVMTDLNMPKMNGETFCRTTNPSKKQRTFLTIIITGSIHPEDRIWLAEMENTRFFEKPFSPSRLIACLDEYFKTGSEQDGTVQ